MGIAGSDWRLFGAPDVDLDFELDRDLDLDVPLFPRPRPCPDLIVPKSSRMAAAGVSPSSSPRLPSPPPFTEVQIGPKSPTVGDSYGSVDEKLPGASHETDDGSTRRIRPGTKAADMASGPPLIPLSQLDSPFQLQEHLKALYHNYTKPDSSRTVVPITREVAVYLAEPPEGVERSLWLYELCRFLTMKVNNLIIAFFAEDPPCSSQTCPEMRASEWQYLCAVHDPPKSCCAIDYCCHTLDWATNILTSPKYFPSRLTLGSEAGGGPQASMRHLTNIFRRLYRIFAHAWFQHRGVFWQVEGHDGLYVFFKTVCDVYNLIPEDNYTIPPEAEGPETQPQTQAPPDNRVEGRRLTILRKESEGRPPSEETTTEPSTISTGATTRRHKHSPSTGSMVTTIAEGAEDSEQEKLQNLEEDLTEDPQTAKPAEEILEGPDSAQQSPVTDTTPIEQEQETKPDEPAAEKQISSEEKSDKPKPEEEPEKSTEEVKEDEETKPEAQAPAEPEREASAAEDEEEEKEEDEERKKDEAELETPTAESDDQAQPQAPAASVESETEPVPEPAKDAKES
ncbi:hypothetical protein VTN00DRAFT_45 [Thermoascus crustaceus]|uniref:uncharacterized protein n=1 Tax=Thermoascus crustaceus TaxID=5088 RepID=UPI0037443252